MMANQLDRFLYSHEHICSFIVNQIEICHHMWSIKILLFRLLKYIVCNAYLYASVKCLLQIYTKLRRVALHQQCSYERFSLFFFCLSLFLYFPFKKNYNQQIWVVNETTLQSYHHQTHYMNRVGLLNINLIFLVKLNERN